MNRDISAKLAFKDRKGRKLSLGEINHYVKVLRAIRLTIELQGKVDSEYAKV